MGTARIRHGSRPYRGRLPPVVRADRLDAVLAAPLRLAPGLVLHGAGGAFTPEAEAVLRHAGGLRL